MPLKLFKRNKIWHYRGTVAGRLIRGSTRTESKPIAQRVASEVENQTWNRHFDGPGAKLTMAQAFIAYREAEKPTRFLERVEDYWKDTPVRDVTGESIKRAAIKLYPDAAPSTRNRQVIVPTQAAINYCAELKWCDRINVKRFDVPFVPKPYATPEWVHLFCEASSPHLAALCVFMFTTGARISEACRLTWANVNFERREIVVGRTKNGDGRFVRMSGMMMEVLANIPVNRNPADRVFGYVKRDSVYDSWDNAIERAAIERMTPHACRHGFATHMLRKGVDVKTVMKRGGWKDERIFIRTYAHEIEDPSIIDDVFDADLARKPTPNRVSHSFKRRKLK